ncbi:MAG TPA: bifunctional glycosyltransferase/class I SAM-dependent methyltransferase [Thermoanaerobaculia bacterium]|nr:bifunctional glycosyltransferase/class I SAM-dependent methyltransferase [Thermoanaerobaculia bacterium]
MSSTSVSILIPLTRNVSELPSTLESVEQYLQTTGFDFDVRVLDSRDGEGYGGMLRRGAAEAKGSVLVTIDPELPYPVSAIGDAVALIESESADIVFAARLRKHNSNSLLRSILVPIIPDPYLFLKAFSSRAARLLLGESKLGGGGFDLEVAYLANKYGFRVETLRVDAEVHTAPTFGAISGLTSAIKIRMTDRDNGYRAPRRCPVCFSSEVWSWAQIPGNVVRACSRCKCRYLNSFGVAEDSHPVRREVRPNPSQHDSADETAHARTARERTSWRRLKTLRKQVAPRSRILEIGVRDGSFAIAAAREYEYVGIDRAAATARAARAKGLEVYCSTLGGFVNTGPAFDAVTLFHVFENMADPHDALARIKDLLKPGGAVLLTAFDTEGLLYLISERIRVAHNFRTHLILYSRSALIELLEHSGFEIVSVAPSFEYRDHKFLRYWITARFPLLAPLVHAILRLLPDPLLVSSGSIRITAKRRAGPPIDVRAIRSVEPTHAR